MSVKRKGANPLRGPTPEVVRVSDHADPNGRVPEESIRERAHRLYSQRLSIGRPGDADSDWFQAIEELRMESSERAPSRLDAFSAEQSRIEL